MMPNPFLAIDKQILAESGTSGEVDAALFELCDRIGPRFAGTDGYRRAAEFMLGRFRQYRLQNAHLEPFAFTAWHRGEPAQLILQTPFVRAIDCYALPYSAATGPSGVTGPLLDIGAGTEADWRAVSQRAWGRMVLTDASGAHRGDVYRKCEALGAAGLVLASRTAGMIPHSGSVANGRGGALPAVSVGCESAGLIRRLARNGKARFKLVTHATLEQATTWNVVGELRGTERPDELVIIGGHLDSHEIGPGAFDNAAGAVLVMEAARLLARQRKHLKRTVRFIGFAAEEVGLLGSHHHAREHAAQMRKARFMLNCDMPSLGRPKGLAFHKCPKAEPYVAMLAEQMTTEILFQNRTHCHSDHYPFILQGVPTAGIAGGGFSAPVQHFEHTAADTPEKISLSDLRDSAAFAARILLRAASDDRWPRLRRTSAEVRAWRAEGTWNA